MNSNSKDWNFKPIVNPIRPTKGYCDLTGISAELDYHLGGDLTYIPTALDTQVGGGHYKGMAIQPVEFCQKNGLNHCESSIVKYACRHKTKNGVEDLKKIIHYAQLLIELEYPEGD